VETLAEAPGYVDFLFLADPVVDDGDWDKAMVPEAAGWLDALLEHLPAWPFEAEELHERTFALAEELGANRRKFQAPIRVALTGRRVGPPLFESMVLLGRDEVVRRLTAARERLDGADG
jgi:glutamyl-tRNA synthetase